MSKQLTIDEEFKNLIPPLAADEFAGLEKSILAEGVREPIITWNGVIVDGHNRYAICQKHAIEYQNRERQFESRDAAKIWIIENQFGRRNLSAYSRGLLALELEPLYAAEAERRLHLSEGRGKKGTQNSSDVLAKGETREKVAKAAGVSHDTIRKIKAIEAEAAKGNPVAVEAKAELESGEKKSIHGAYIRVTGGNKARTAAEATAEDGRRLCSMCGEPINPGEASQHHPTQHKECRREFDRERKRERRAEKRDDPEKSLLQNVAVYNRASLIAELNGSAEMLETSWKQSLEINEGQGVRLTEAEKNNLQNAISGLYTAISKIKREG